VFSQGRGRKALADHIGLGGPLSVGAETQNENRDQQKDG
jgi:hypothetical protein